MNKAMPWNVNGVGFDAREAAREAARRQGKSLGEWLHEVIADHAADLGVDEPDLGGRQRVDAVRSKLERLTARGDHRDRRQAETRDDEDHHEPQRSRRERGETYLRAVPSERAAQRPSSFEPDERGRERPLRAARRTDEAPGGALRRRRETLAMEAAEQLLEDAVEAMERRANRVERQTEYALQSVTELIERNETSRERERESVKSLAEKLSAIETRLSDRLATPDQTPIQGALARLETRLEAIGRRSAAETAILAPRPVPVAPLPPIVPPSETFDRLEAKLNSILSLIQQPAAAQQPAPPPHPAPRTSRAAEAIQADPYVGAPAGAPLGTADRRAADVYDILRRQRDLDEGLASRAATREASLRQHLAGRREPVSASLDDVRRELATLALRVDDVRRQPVSVAPALDQVKQEIAALSRHVEDVHRQPAAVAPALDQLKQELAALSRNVEDMRRQPAAPALDQVKQEIASLATGVEEMRRELAAQRSAPRAGAPTLDGLRQEVSAMADMLRGLAQPPARAEAAEAPNLDVGRLESMVLDLTRKIEAVQAPDASDSALDALQAQVGQLTQKLDTSHQDLDKLSALERSMRDIFVHLDETRASVETSAARVAQEVMKIALDESRARSDHDAAHSLATLHALHEDAEARTSAALTAVQATLSKVVERLGTMEADLAAGRAASRGGPQDKPAKGPETDLRLGPLPPASNAARMAPAARDTMKEDPVLDHRPGEFNEPMPTRAKRPELDDDGRADFIAAARRAAKAAQAAVQASDIKRPMAKVAEGHRESLVAQSRAYVAQHKRPVLLGIAALFVVLGTLAIVQRFGFDDGASQTADLAKPVRVAGDPGVPAAPTTRPDDTLSPSALPVRPPAPLATPIPGSDPIHTASIPSLPAFAAGASLARPAQPPANLRALAASGDAAAEFILGAQYAEGRVVPRDFAEAAKWYEKAALQNIAPAQYRLASLYEKGLGVPQNKDRARALYTQAAQAGNPRAMHNLAVLLAEGGNGQPDYEGAANWFRKAAQYGIRDSQYNLAILLARGIGVPQSLVQSYQWFAVAAGQGDTDAAKKRDEVASKLSANDLAVAKALASAFHPRTADLAATDVQLQTGV
jgi:localization factor PodJL